MDSARLQSRMTTAVEPDTAPRAGRPLLSDEAKAALLLSVGSFIPIAGCLAGSVLTWQSKILTRRDKVLATLFIPGGPFIALVLVFGPLGDNLKVTCLQGFTSTLESIDGPSISTTAIPMSCSTPNLNPWIGLPLVVLVILASLVGPLLVWSKARWRFSPAES